MADISPITATNSIYSPATSNPSITPKTLNQDDFLKLLVTQFTNQDPMNPMKDTEYIAQMAQFTTLEQAKATSAEISKLRADNQLLQANALLGRSVSLQSSQDNNAVITGTVSAVQMEAGTPKIVVNGQPYDLSTLLSIQPAKTP